MKHCFGFILALLLATSAAAVDLADFCDTSPNHGSTKSCDATVTVPAGTCPANTHPGTPKCTKSGQACTAGGQTGNWCQNCTVSCIRNTVAEPGDPFPVEPHGQ